MISIINLKKKNKFMVTKAWEGSNIGNTARTTLKMQKQTGWVQLKLL